jgi:hypothetical protein
MGEKTDKIRETFYLQVVDRIEAVKATLEVRQTVPEVFNRACEGAQAVRKEFEGIKVVFTDEQRQKIEEKFALLEALTNNNA